MNSARMHDPDSTESAPVLRSPMYRRIGIAIGIVLFVVAIVFVWTRRVDVIEAIRTVGNPDPRLIALLLGVIIANLALTGIMFHVLTARYGKVGFIEMQALIGATMLLNYAPLRPGLFGRIAYHKTVNNIRARDAALVVVHAVCISAVLALWLIACVLICARMEWTLWPLAVAPGVMCIMLALFPGDVRPWAIAALVRLTEMLLWALRYKIAFELIGITIEFDDAVAIACAGVIATMVPLVSNGIGLREWTVGLIGTMVSPAVLGVAITAELVNRAAEILVALACGTAGLVYLARRTRTPR